MNESEVNIPKFVFGKIIRAIQTKTRLRIFRQTLTQNKWGANQASKKNKSVTKLNDTPLLQGNKIR